MFTVTVAEYLISIPGRHLILEAEALMSQRIGVLAALTKMRKSAPSDIASAAWEVAELRRRATPKIGPNAGSMFFDRDGYEMASSLQCASYHSDMLKQAGADSVIDTCAGTGIDACHFGQNDLTVTAFEIDEARACFARANVNALSLQNKITVYCGDVTSAKLPAYSFAFFDPARRLGTRRRIVDGDDLMPPFSFMNKLISSGVHSVLAKLSPATDRNAGRLIDGDVEYVSSSGECKEALIRIGDLRSNAGVSAVLIDCGARIDGPPPVVKVQDKIAQYLYEPDPAVIRAGLVASVAEIVDGWLLDANIAYIQSASSIATPFATAYRILEYFPFHLRSLQDALRRREAGNVVVKRRAFPYEPEEIRKRLKLTGSKEVTVILTRTGNRLDCMIVERLNRGTNCLVART